MPNEYTEGEFNNTPLRKIWQEQHVAPVSQVTLAEDEKYFLHQSLSTPCLTEIIGSYGPYITDASGKHYLDFHGNSLHQIGYSHPKVIQAIKAQLDELSFCPRRFTNKPSVELARRLSSLAPGNLNRILFSPGGTSAVGMAMKLARYATGKYKTISMWGTFHGASLDAISIGGEDLFRDDLGPLLPGTFHVPWPQKKSDADNIEKILKEEKDIGAIITEPMRCTTIERPENEYWHRIRELCDQYNSLLIFDEIPLAFGRTGKMFCCEHSGVTPDILVIGKGLGGGVIPMSAIIAREDLNVVPTKALGHYTHEKSPVGAASALAMLDVVESENLIERSRLLGDETKSKMQELFCKSPIVREVRGLGLAMAIELATAQSAEQVMYDCLSKGLSFKVSNGNILTLTPPLTITDEEMARAISILKNAIQNI